MSDAHLINVKSIEPRDLVLQAASGNIYFANGRGSFSIFGEVTLEKALASFDRWADWVRDGNGSPDDDASPEMRELVIRAHEIAAQAAGGVV